MNTIDRSIPPDSVAADHDISATDYLQLRDYIRVVYRRRWLIGGVIGVGLLWGAVYIWTTTPLFEARATVQIDTDLNVLGVDRPLLPLDQRDWMREFLPTQLGILQSREFARLAQNELLSRGGETEVSTNEVTPNGAPNQPPDGGAPPVPTVGEIMAGRTTSSIADTRLLNIGFRSPDPQMSARVANALAAAYLRMNREFKAKTSSDASLWLVKQVAEQRKLVEQSEAALLQYRRDHGADALMTNRLGSEQQNVVVQKLAALQAAETEARTETILKESAYRQLLAAQANREPLDTVPAIASNSFIQGLKTELATLQRQLAQASNELGELHPELVKLRGAVQSAERKVQTEVANAASAIRNDFEAARARERAMVADLQRQKVEVQALNSKAVEYTSLEREASTNRDLLDRLLQRSREAELSSELQSTNVRIVDWAEVPWAPVVPRKGRTMMLALVGSGSVALGLVFLLEIFNTRIRSPHDVKQHLRIPVVGVVPQVKPRNGRASLLLGNGAPTQFTELFQGVRTNLVMAPHAAAGQILLVTSSEPSEGKTVSAANLAVSLSRLNQRVVLIDADLRKPRLHEVFGVEQQPGLADVLGGKTTTRDFRKTKTPGLWLMPAGKAVHNPSDLLGSSRFSELIEHLRQHFDWIVLDSSPVMAVTDACLIARIASGVLLVVDAAHTSREVAAAAVERLDAVGANMMGAILNRVVLDLPGESYLPYYHRDYKDYYVHQEFRGDGASTALQGRGSNFWPPEVPITTLKRESAAAPSPTVEA